MANIKSAARVDSITRAHEARNESIRSEVKTEIKKVEALAAAGDKAAAEEALKHATSVIEKAGTKGVYAKNNVSRKVSRVAKAVAKVQ